MSGPFNLSATLSVRLAQGTAANLRSEIQRATAGLSATVDVKIDPRSLAALGQLKNSTGAATLAVASLGTAANTAANNLDRMGAAATRAAAAAGTLTGLTNATTAATTRAAAAFSAAGTSAAGFGGQVGGAGRQVASLLATVGPAAAALSRLGVGLASTRATAAALVNPFGSMTGAIRENIVEAIAFNRELTRLAQVSSEPASAVRGLGDDVQRLGAQLGVSSVGLAKVAVDVKQAGYSLSETRQVIEAIGKGSLLPTFDSPKQLSELVI